MASRKRYHTFIFILIFYYCHCYEKTLRKIVRNPSKMIQQPFSSSNDESRNSVWKNLSSESRGLLPPGLSQVKKCMHKLQRQKISTILSPGENARGKTTYSKMKISRTESINPLDLRMTRNTFKNLSMTFSESTDKNFPYSPPRPANISKQYEIMPISFYQIPSPSKFFPPVAERDLQNVDQKYSSGENTIVIPSMPEVENVSNSFVLKSMFLGDHNEKAAARGNDMKDNIVVADENEDKAEFLIKEITPDLSTRYGYNITVNPFRCTTIEGNQVDVDAQTKFFNLDIEPTWMSKKQFWDYIFDSRYESLMRSSTWPPLNTILMPSSHVDSIWKKSFEQYYNNTVSKILSNMVKKLQFYGNLTFTWNEISHLSLWWTRTTQRSRSAFRKLLKSGRLEITTGWWVETEEAPAHIFGMVHQLIEGHQWLKDTLNYFPKVGWSTNSVTHSPTLTYLLSAAGISKYVITNVHFSWEQYLAEFQYSDFIWLQDWDSNKETSTDLNQNLNRIGNNRYPKHTVFTHFLQFNRDNYKGCGPIKEICATNFDFINTRKNIDIQSYNIKQKSEILLEQYSKTGTITPHNVVAAPLGGRYRYESQMEFDYTYNNYQRLIDYINSNSDIYRANLEFGTPTNYFNTIFKIHKSYPTIKGDFLNFADIQLGIPGYWTGFFTSRPLLKILLRRIQATLRTSEILLSFALNYNVLPQTNATELYQLLIKSRENVARLQDRHVVGGTLSMAILQYVYRNILSIARSCWIIQEAAASLLTAKPGTPTPFLKKFVYREGEFISSFKTISPGDKLFFFNPLGQERTEVVEFTTKQPNIRVIDYNKKELTIQISPTWNCNSDNVIKVSRIFFKISFVIVIPPMTLELYKIKSTYDATNNVATVYCDNCLVDGDDDQSSVFPFNIQPLQAGDVQLESYKHRIIIDELTGFLKTVIEKETNTEKTVLIDYGAFRSSVNAGMFLFNTNVTNPLYDVLFPYRIGSKLKVTIITAGLVTTEMTSIYGRLLQHTIKLYNLVSSPLAQTIFIESKVDYEASPKNRELELFLSLKTDINNGNNPEIVIDNNGFQYTSHVLNISRRIESNMYPITSMAFIQDQKSRMTLITDHTQAVTAFQEGHLAVMLDRRVLYNDERGTNEGLADSSTTYHRHYLLLENFQLSSNLYSSSSSKSQIKLPSSSAAYLSSCVDYSLDIFLVDKKSLNLSYYAFLPLIKTPLPCDISILNFRTIVNKVSYTMFLPNMALLVLHRKGVTCHIESSLFVCNGEPNFVVDKVFHNIKATFQTNLVGTDDGVPLNIVSQENMAAMELKTLKMYF